MKLSHLENVRLDTVTDTLRVYQHDSVFPYGTDAVCLTRFVQKSIKTLAGKTMCDLCAGTGIIPLMLCDSDRTLKATLVELNENAVLLARESAAVSRLTESVSVIHGDIADIKKTLPSDTFDFVTCNPPYMTTDCGKMCLSNEMTSARHEADCTVDTVFEEAFHLLKTGGALFLVYRTDRLSSIFEAARRHRVAVKHLVFLQSKKDASRVQLCLIKAVKLGKEGLLTDVITLEKLLQREAK